MAGNPVLSAPDAGRLDEALPMLDAMISVDNWLNETTRHAHVILPGLYPLEPAHHDALVAVQQRKFSESLRGARVKGDCGVVANGVCVADQAKLGVHRACRNQRSRRGQYLTTPQVLQ